ncbi:MAG: ATPase, T2SS/T4P/T4SS family [Rhodoferax sp.]|nr:ATPase, T2SS/T4P/T4SS family [Rhodoferax sp.]
MSITPTEQTALIQIENSKTPVTLAFSQFRRLTLKNPIHPQEIVSTEQFADILSYRATVQYHLQLGNGSEISGMTVGHVETDYGLFLFHPLNDQGSVERVFVPHDAFLSVTLGDHIGEMLVEQAIVTTSQVEQAAEEQHSRRNRKLGDYLVDTAVVQADQLMLALDQQSKMPMIRVGEALTRLGYIDEEQLKLALEKQKTARSVPLGQLLLNMGFLTRHDLNMALARKMGYPVVDVTQFPIEAEALKKISMNTALRLNIMPLMSRSNLTVVAAIDPTHRKMLEELEFLVQGRVIATLGDELQIAETIPEIYKKFGLYLNESSEHSSGQSDSVDSRASASELLETMELSNPEEETEKQLEQSDNTLVRLINTMIIEANALGVSDIHVECQPRHSKIRIRFRKDGLLTPYLELPHTYRSALVARLKIMADLDISERRKPQDGKINFHKFSSRYRLELRIATIPTANGLEDVVMRLLSSSKPLAMDKLGLTQVNFEQLRDAVNRPYGMVLCVGPTGSGKTTTLHSVLGFLNTPSRKIWTAEDPIEITQPDLRQVQVNPKIDWTFAKALRSFLRADPDIIMVGEIRDAETAQIAIEASLTGHMMLSTLHTNSAAETVTRLVDMGMDPFNFADSLLAVLAQRLARRFCTACRTYERAPESYVEEILADYLHSFPPNLRPPSEEILALWSNEFGRRGGLSIYSAPGCKQCLGTGMTGRVGLHELLRVTPGIRRLIQTGARSELIQAEAFAAGQFRTLRQDGILKVLSGQTSIEEVRANSNA